MDWNTIAAVAQALQALVVMVTIPFLYFQIRQVRTELRHRRWESLQWALNLIPDNMIPDFLRMAREGKEITYDDDFIDMDQRLIQLRTNLGLISVAIKKGYLDQDLFFLARANQLRELDSKNLQMVIGDKHRFRTIFALLDLTGRAGELIDAATEWWHREGFKVTITEEEYFDKLRGHDSD